MDNRLINDLKMLGVFFEIDFHFAQFINVQAEKSCDELYLASLLVSYFSNKQHTAFSLKENEQKLLIDLLEIDDEVECPCTIKGLKLPSFEVWRMALVEAAKVVGKPGERKPLILSDSGLLSLHRYHNYESIVADFIIKGTQKVELDLVKTKAVVTRLFPTREDDLNWQEVAAFAAVNSRFCVISGGPGTGKTTTVAKVLALLLELEPELKVDLVAPTGKAADRLAQSITLAKGSSMNVPLYCSDEIKEKIPSEASTIHRFLGYIHNSSKFRFNSENKKGTDLLLVDEASMVSLPMFAKLFSALKSDCRVILLGDKDQLAAVESGNVLGDITDAESINQFSSLFKEDYSAVAYSSRTPALLSVAPNPSALDNAVVKLEKSYRFTAESGIGQLSALVNVSRADEALDFLKHKKMSDSSILFDDIHLRELPDRNDLADVLKDMVKKGSDGLKGYREYLAAVKDNDPELMMKAFGKFKILCATHSGIYGVEQINELVEKILFPGKTEFNYIGKAIMVTSNDYNLNLFNGDVGVMAEDRDGKLQVYFPGVNGELRALSPILIPESKLAFAVTIHKSQGSEFNDVLLVMPEKHAKVLAKELVYTGITRAKENIAVWSKDTVFKQAVKTQITRTSGLAEALLE